LCSIRFCVYLYKSNEQNNKDMTTANTTPKAFSLDLGYIDADKLRKILLEDDNQNDFNAKYENGYFCEIQGNQDVGVVIYSNVHKSKKHLKKRFYSLLLLSL